MAHLTYDQIRSRARLAAEGVEREALRETLDTHGWRLPEASEALETSPQTLHRALVRVGLSGGLRRRGRPPKKTSPDA